MTRRRLRVLLAEGSGGEASAALQELYARNEPGLDLTVVSTVATLLPAIKAVNPEVILMDLALNLREPMDAVHLVHRTAPGVPLIVFADSTEKQQAIRSLAEGAMDFVVKGHIDADVIERVVLTALERNTLTGLTDLLRDEVTGLYSREGFLTLGALRLEEAIRTRGSLVLLCVLCENLESQRQSFGAQIADRAVGAVSGLLKACCRRGDVVGRLGETHFAILGVNALASTGAVMRNRLEQHLAVHNRTRSLKGPIHLRMSIGAWTPADGGTFAELLDSIECGLLVSAPDMQN
jgi:diguanylate cyclase (GGDEF)-like protein